MNSDQLDKLVKAIDLHAVTQRAATSYDLTSLDPAIASQVIYAAVSCTMNGPVGVGKDTTFPGSSESYRIKDKWPTVTNSVWKAFCRDVVKHVNEESADVKTCYTVVKFGQLWPLCDAIFVPKQKNP
jgi:hypothetical protein